MRSYLTILLLGLFFCSFAQNEVLLPAKDGNKWGYINASGKWKIEAQFDRCREFGDRFYSYAQVGDKSILIDRNGRSLGNLPTNDIVDAYNNLFVFKDSTKLGWYNALTKRTVDPEFSELKFIPDLNGFRAKIGDSIGIVDSLGHEIVPVQFHALRRRNNIVYVTSKGKKGIRSIDGSVSVPCIYETIDTYRDVFIVKDSSKFMKILDSKGEVLYKGKVTRITPVTSTLYTLYRKKKTFLLDIEKKRIIDSLANKYEAFENDILLVSKKEGQGLLSLTSTSYLLQCENKTIHKIIGSDYLMARKDEVYQIYNKQGEVISERAYITIGNFDSMGYSIVFRNGKYGLLKADAKEVLPCQYDRIHVGEGGVIKTKNDEVITLFEFDETYALVDSMQFSNTASVDLDGRLSMFLNSGANNTSNLSGYWYKNPKGKWGMLDSSGKSFIKPIFDEITKIQGTPYVLGKYRTHKEMRIGADITLISTAQYGVVDEVQFKKITPFTLMFIDMDDFRDTSLHVVRIMYSSGTFGTINKKTGRQLRYTSRYMDAFEGGYARIFVGQKLRATYAKPRYVHVDGVSAYCSQFGLILSRSTGLKSPQLDGQGYWAYINKEGKYIKGQIALKNMKIIRCEDFRNERAVVVDYKNRYGLINGKGEYILAPEFKDISFLPGTNDSLLKTEVFTNRSGYVAASGRYIAPVIYHTPYDFNNGFAWAQTGNTTELIRLDGTRKILEGRYKTTPISQGLAGVALGYKYAIIDTNLNFLTDHVYTRVGQKTTQYLPVKRKGTYRFLDDDLIARGLVDKIKLTKVGTFQNGYAAVRYAAKNLYSDKQTGQHFGYINTSGELAIKGKYSRVYDFDSLGFALVKKRNYRGIVSHTTKTIVPVRYSKVYGGDGYFVGVGVASTVIYDTLGKKIKRLRGKARTGVNDGVLVIRHNNKFGVVNNQGKKILPYKYTQLSAFEDGIASCIQGRNTLVIDKDGDTLSTIIGRPVKHGFKNGLLLIKTGKKFWYANALGNNAFGMFFEDAEPFENGLAIVKQDGKYGMIDYKGYFRIYPEYDEVDLPVNGVSTVKLYSALGVCDLNGSYLLAPRCNKVTYLQNEDVFQYQYKNAYGYFSSDAKLFWEVK